VEKWESPQQNTHKKILRSLMYKLKTKLAKIKSFY
jgi:hypothetical protein